MLTPNPDILATLSAPGPLRPRLVVGFAAETEDVAANAAAKRLRKGCDWIVANDVRPATGIMAGEATRSTSSPPRGRRTGRCCRRPKSPPAWPPASRTPLA